MKSEYRLKINVIDFLKEIKDLKDLNLIEKKYEKKLNCVFSNRKRVLDRLERKELRNIKISYLKEINFNIEDYNKVMKRLKVNSKNNKYISVKI